MASTHLHISLSDLKHPRPQLAPALPFIPDYLRPLGFLLSWPLQYLSPLSPVLSSAGSEIQHTASAERGRLWNEALPLIVEAGRTKHRKQISVIPSGSFLFSLLFVTFQTGYNLGRFLLLAGLTDG